MIENNISMEEVDEITSEPIQLMEQSNINNLINDNWYKDHPEKILGIPYEATGRFGKVTKYSGTIEVLNKIEVDESFFGATKVLNDPMASVNNDINVSAELQKLDVAGFVESVIEKSVDEIKESKKSKSKVVKSDAKFTPVEELNSFEQTFRNLNINRSKVIINTKTKEKTTIQVEDNSLEEVEVFTWYKSSIGKPLSKNYVKLFKPEMFEGESELQLRETYNYSVTNNVIEGWVREGLLFYYDGNLLPKYEYKSGNIYDKKSKLEKDEKDEIITRYGQQVYDNQLVTLQEAFNEVYQRRLLIGSENSLVVLANSKIANEFMIERIQDLAEGVKFKIKQITTSDNKKYGRPDFIKDLANDKNRKEFSELSLSEAFSWWLLNTKPLLKENISHLDIYKYYVAQKNLIVASKDDTQAEKKKAEAQKEKLKSSTQREGERLFALFLSTQLLPADKLKLETLWNVDYNNYLPINLDKIPVAFTMAKNVFGKPEIVLPEKRDAVAFTMSNGTGILSYDVGVGKTPSAIFTISAFLDAGYCKRPLIVVPNQVYRQFISEIKIFTPHIPIVEGYNLSAEYIENFKNAKGEIEKVPVGSITIITYDGFRNIGFNDNTADLLQDKLFEILNQGFDTNATDKQNAKKEALMREKIDTTIGKALRGGIYNIEDLGFDFMCYDEAHKMKKVFSTVKGTSETDEKGNVSRGKNPYEITSGSPSSVGLKGFMINYYVLQQNDFKNILMLTATPFTNSPLEIFSMLSMVAYETLRGSSLDNLKAFFDTYVKTSTQLVINSKLKPQFKPVILGFNNLISLQSLIRRFILYKTGDDVGVKRPKKYVLPYLKVIENDMVVNVSDDKKVETFIGMTPQQSAMMDDIIQYVEHGTELGASNYNDEEDEDSEIIKDEDESDVITGGGVEVDEDSLSESEKQGVRTIKGLSYSRNLALSPYLYKYSGLGKPDYKSYVEKSPKLNYVMKCIKSVKDYCISNNQPIAGQVIYMDRGVEYFGFLKEYLVNELGYNKDEVGIIKSGLKSTGTTSKEYIKNLFNGQIYNENTQLFDNVEDFKRIKVVIGSSTIKEGMNLQKYGAVLYNCFIDWNPTDIQQLEGRIYRQGNNFEAVRIVNPLVVDSADIFLFQKLQEKTSRLNSIWSTDGHTNVLDTSEFNAEELKYALIRDPRVIAEIKIIETRGYLESEILALDRQLDIVSKVSSDSRTIARQFDIMENSIKYYRDFIKTGNKIEDASKLVKIINDLEKKQTDKDGKKILKYDERRYMKDEDLEDVSPLYNKYVKPYYFLDFAIAVRNLVRFESEFFKQYNIDFDIDKPDTSLQNFTTEVRRKKTEVEDKIEELSTEAYIDMLIQDAIEEKEKNKINYKTLPQLVSDFGKLNFLLDKRKVILTPTKELKMQYNTCPPYESDGVTPAVDEEALRQLKICIDKEPQTKYLHFDENTGYTIERKKLHNKIVNELFKKVKCIKQGQQPIAIFTGGSPASGKSFFLRKNADYLMSDNIFKIDADSIREMLPEYKGWNASATQSETNDIINDLLDKLGSQDCKYDFIYDGTMNKAKKYFDLIRKVKGLGYKTYIIFMEVPYAVAKERSLKRYQDTSKQKGRYVPIEVIDDFFTKEGDKTKGQVSLDQLKTMVDGYVVADGITGNVISAGGEKIPDTRDIKVYTETPVLKAETTTETESTTPSKEDVMKTIKALKFLADAGNEDAKKTIKSLKFLL